MNDTATEKTSNPTRTENRTPKRKLSELPLVDCTDVVVE